MYQAHSALGVAVGLYLYVVMATGVPALFVTELGPWANPALRIEFDGEVDIERAVAEGEKHAPQGTDDIHIFMPSTFHPAVQYLFRGKGVREWLDLHPESFEPLERTDHGFRQVWREAHTNLFMGRVGRYLVGFAGLLACFMIGSGLLAHRKILKELFTWRRERSFRVSVGDLHKLIGTWGALPFAVIAFTGAVLGLLGILTLANAMVAYGGDQEKALAAVVGPSVVPKGEPRGEGSVRLVVEKARAAFPEIEFDSVALIAWNDANAHVELDGTPRGTISMGSSVRYRLVDGELVHEVHWVGKGFWRRAFGLVSPLHFANFGGVVVKLVYAVFGIAGAIMVAAGLLIWIAKRGAGRSARLATGVIGGVPLATFWSVVVDCALTATVIAPGVIVTCCYLGSLVMAVVFAFAPAQEQALGRLLVAAGGCAMALPLIDIVAHVGSGIALTTNCSVAMAGAGLLALSTRLQRSS